MSSSCDRINLETSVSARQHTPATPPSLGKWPRLRYIVDNRLQGLFDTRRLSGVWVVLTASREEPLNPV
jgi:hypothetical protein